LNIFPEFFRGSLKTL